jgi:hypothetical protein
MKIARVGCVRIGSARGGPTTGIEIVFGAKAVSRKPHPFVVAWPLGRRSERERRLCSRTRVPPDDEPSPRGSPARLPSGFALCPLLCARIDALAVHRLPQIAVFLRGGDGNTVL